jgi:hypothetical protein
MSDLNKKFGCDRKQLFLSDLAKYLPTMNLRVGRDPATRIQSVYEYEM